MKPSEPVDNALRDPVASHLGYLLRRASAVVMAGLATVLAEVELRPVEGTILILVGANPGCIQSDLGRTLGVKRANMVPLITGLASRGYLKKAPVDGRSMALSLTDTGAIARDRVEAIMATREQEVKGLLDGVDIAALRDTLARIAQTEDDSAA